LSKRIFIFELDGKPVLGFDTGLSAQAFAQAKLAQFINQSGSIVYPDGKIETWQPGGVAEHETMVIWGSPFYGEALTEIINAPDRKDEALDALRCWLKAIELIRETPYDGPAGVFFASEKTRNGAPFGAVFFPPARLMKRILDADNAVPEAEQWVHPDLKGAEAVSFAAGTMLYRIFCGERPFTADNEDELLRDIREGVFIPPVLAAPGLDPEMSSLISSAMSRIPQNNEPGFRPTPESIIGLLGLPSSKPVSAWFTQLSDEEISKINAEREKFVRKKSLSVKARRFVIRNTVLIAVSAAVILIIALIARGIIQRQKELPSTMGMNPVEVAEAYYGAFETLDHVLMEACVSGKAGADDIRMVMNLFVISRVRQGYEQGGFFMTASEWLETGRPFAEDKMVFGIAELKISVLSLNEENAGIRANYILIAPGVKDSDEDSGYIAEIATSDRLDLIFQKGAWRITNIERNSQLPFAP